MTSEARIAANRANSLKSTGPTTTAGRERSRRNGLKHGLTGQGVVMPEQDADEVGRRVEALEADLDPQSPLGQILVRQIAALSVKMERGTRQESAALASRVRHAAEEFDVARIEEVERLFEGIAADPRGHVRKLRRSPEGVDRLIAAWRELRDALTRGPRPAWTPSHHEKAANLAGLRGDDANHSRVGVLSRAVRADFAGLASHEGGGLDHDARRDWARARLVERIDEEVAELQAHRESLDLDAIELDRLEAGDRALFDPSREATLARRYESEARRGFFKALKEFRQAEAEAAERVEAESAPAPVSPPAPRPEIAGPRDRLASCWEGPSPMLSDPRPAFEEAAATPGRTIRGPVGPPSRTGRPVAACG